MKENIKGAVFDVDGVLEFQGKDILKQLTSLIQSGIKELSLDF